ncbi:FAD-binding oxidoreductase [Loktanella sp. F6476L]|uniref:NAD(P)/FAD-dependent oxidoreductase n=1 Tax=Loktanella sp. F6476L TaxID=2926405 RepID=UPI001FF20C53|nr:FAD-dependent oxidoreductase [Loktanella sp. F6476L]MCK0120306.1 FAD-binding oxidoreductase [Loktanella sp. F6476L]
MIDFLVIGGGIAGLSVAARLAIHGKVTVLEAENSVGHHASGRSAALFEENYGNAAVKALNKASTKYHKTAHGGVLSPRGLMLVGRTGEEAAFADDVQNMHLTEITVTDAAGMIPILDTNVLTHAAYDAGALDIDTDLLSQNFARDLRAHRGTIVTNAAVTSISRTDHGWQVYAGEMYDAKVIINAAGAWVDQIAAMADISPLVFQPYKRSMARIPAPGGHDVSDWPMVFGVNEAWYAKPDAGALIVSPADEEPAEPHDAWADDMVLAEGLDRYSQQVTEPVTRLLASWAGLRTFAPDRALVLGPSTQDDSFIWCAGQGGYGFATAPAASKLVSDSIAGKPSELGADIVAALSPSRFT